MILKNKQPGKRQASARFSRTRCNLTLHSAGIWCALPAIILARHAVPVQAQCEEQQTLTAIEVAPDAILGHAVSVSGNMAVASVGGDGCPAGRPFCGSAHVFRFDGTDWVLEQKLTAADERTSHFASSVSASGDMVLAGSRYERCSDGFACGAAHVFRFDGHTWGVEQELTASDGGADDQFGWSVSVSQDTALVGAIFDDCVNGDHCGSAYVYRFNGTSWVEEQKLTATDAHEYDKFGSSVAISGNTAVVGAPHKACQVGNLCGSAYVYRFDGSAWVEEQKLTESNGSIAHYFGQSVSVSGDKVVVGAIRSSIPQTRWRGSASVFRFDGDTWVEEQKLNGTASVPQDFFGFSVSISGDTTVVGAPSNDCPEGEKCGAAYLFRFNGSSWIREQKLTASDADAADEFGQSVSVSGNTALVGSSKREACTKGEYCGAAYLYSCPPPPMIVDVDIKPASCPNMVNPRSQGVVTVAVVGSVDLNVAEIDPDSLTLARADGVGSAVSPLTQRGGRGIVLRDVGTSFVGEPCTCHDVDRDQIDDLAMKFSTSAMSRGLEMNGLPRGTSIELVLRGTLQDATTFEGVDCIVIPGSQRSSNRRLNLRRP